jgi:hypothetical protein
MDAHTKKRLEMIEANARARVREFKVPRTDQAAYFKRFVDIPHPPIFIASSEDLGTNRVRANHNDAMIDYFMEQENLRRINAPL